MQTYSIWHEGYLTNGEQGQASLLGEASANSFDEAVTVLASNWDKTERHLFSQSPDGTWRFWGCRLFDNKTDAMKFRG